MLVEFRMDGKITTWCSMDIRKVSKMLEIIESLEHAKLRGVMAMA